MTLELIGGPKDGHFVPDTGPEHLVPLPPERTYITEQPIRPGDTLRVGIYRRRRAPFSGTPYYEWEGAR